MKKTQQEMQYMFNICAVDSFKIMIFSRQGLLDLLKKMKEEEMDYEKRKNWNILKI